MTSRRIFVIGVPLGLAALAAWIGFRKDGSSRSVSAEPISLHRQAPDAASPSMSGLPDLRSDPSRVTSSVTPGAPLVRTASTPTTPVAAAASSRPESQAEGKADLESVRLMLRDFRTRMRENPVGSNAEIMRAMMGSNEVGMRLEPPGGLNLNANGELLDLWGTPFFFHQLSKDSMEIRSAGPDCRLWTADDLVTK